MSGDRIRELERELAGAREDNVTLARQNAERAEQLLLSERQREQLTHENDRLKRQCVRLADDKAFLLDASMAVGDRPRPDPQQSELPLPSSEDLEC